MMLDELHLPTLEDGWEQASLAFHKIDTGTVSPVSILHKSIAGRYRPVRVPDGPITARYRFM